MTDNKPDPIIIQELEKLKWKFNPNASGFEGNRYFTGLEPLGWGEIHEDHPDFQAVLAIATVKTLIRLEANK